MHTAEAAAAPAAAPTAAPAAPGTFWQLFSKCSDPSSSDPSSLFRIPWVAARSPFVCPHAENKFKDED